MKRFIAGASCPECNQTDSLYFETTEREDKVHCTRCEHQSLRGESGVAEEAKTAAKKKDEQKIKWH